jgi:hypothetical protein
MTNLVEIEIRKVYGVDKFYPTNETAQLLAALVGHKTLSSADISIICKLGFNVQAMQPKPINWREMK